MNVVLPQSAIRARDVVAAEVTKIVTHPATPIALTLAAIANLGLAIIDAIGVSFYTSPGEGPASLSSFGSVVFAPVYAFLVLPVYAAGSEYHGGQLRITLTATPKRRALVTAKLIAMITVVLPAVLVTLVPARLTIGISDGLNPGELLLDLSRWIAVYLLMSLIAFGIAGLLRSTIAPLTILVLVPVFVGTGILQWPEGIRFLPDQASMSLLGTPAYEVAELAPGVAALALIAWASLAVGAFAVSLVRRDT